MSNKETGGFAFPGLNAEMTGIDSDGNERFDTEQSSSMTLRDHFAGKALEGFCAGDTLEGAAKASIQNAVAKICYQMADAMLEARK